LAAASWNSLEFFLCCSLLFLKGKALQHASFAMTAFLVLAVGCSALVLAIAAESAYGEMPWVSWWGNPVASKNSIVISAFGTARFTVLTSQLLRIERAATAGVFLDARSSVVWNRELPTPEFSATTDISSGITTITTSDIQLQFIDSMALPGALPPTFSDSNLHVTRFSSAFWPNSATWVTLQFP
jgi:hypothetical protein